MGTITKKDLVERIADEQSCRRVLVKRVLQAFLDAIVEELGNGNRLEFRDFGVFECTIRASRRAQNPKTLDKLVVPSRRTVKFKVGREMRARLERIPIAVDEATGLAVEPGARSTRSRTSQRDAAVPRSRRPKG
ncbi:MAG: HU family DNA-binding protein [Phycisphaerae bacterium]